MLGGLVEVGEHRLPVVTDVVGGAPQIAHIRCPLPRLVDSPLADAEHDRAAGAIESATEFRVLRWRIEPVGVAPIFLYVIDAPAGVSSRVAFLVAECARPSLAGFRSGVGVDAELQTFRVHVIGEGFDAVRKTLRIGDDRSRWIATDLPAIVDYDVLVTGVAHATRDHRVGGFPDQRFADIAAEMVPAIPTQRWCERDASRRRCSMCGRGAECKEQNSAERQESASGPHESLVG